MLQVFVFTTIFWGIHTNSFPHFFFTSNNLHTGSWQHPPTPQE